MNAYKISYRSPGMDEMMTATVMKKLGLKPGDTKLIYRAPGGMYYRKTDSDSLKEMMARFDREKEAAIVGDTTGEGFILDMFSTELANHEFG